METVYLALGSNIGDRQRFISQAIELLGEKLSNVRQAPLYASQAVGYTDQPDFLNTVICGQTKLTPQELLEFTQMVEQRIGRTKTFHWGPREIDIDIILYGDKIIDGKDLTIPHPHFAERDFVLQPLCDLVPEAVDPITHHTAQQLLKAVTQRSIIAKA